MTDRPDDFDLLDAWRAGDERAGGRLFRRHAPSLCRFFRNKVRDGVEDLMQQTFLRCVQGRDRFRGDASFRTYLFAVARNELYDHLRRIRPTEPFDSQVLSAADVTPAPDHALAHKHEQKLLLEALRAIPLDLQLALELYYWEAMPAREIGGVLDLPEGTVRSRIRRAKTLLRRELERLAPSALVLASTVEHLDDWARSLRDYVEADARPPQEP